MQSIFSVWTLEDVRVARTSKVNSEIEAPGGFSLAFDMLIYMMSRAYSEKISFITFFSTFHQYFHQCSWTIWSGTSRVA